MVSVCAAARPEVGTLLAVIDAIFWGVEYDSGFCGKVLFDNRRGVV